MPEQTYEPINEDNFKLKVVEIPRKINWGTRYLWIVLQLITGALIGIFCYSYFKLGVLPW